MIDGRSENFLNCMNLCIVLCRLHPSMLLCFVAFNNLTILTPYFKINLVLSPTLILVLNSIRQEQVLTGCLIALPTLTFSLLEEIGSCLSRLATMGVCPPTPPKDERTYEITLLSLLKLITCYHTNSLTSFNLWRVYD